VKLSVIIATHARPDSLASLIASLKPQLRLGAHELIVADNGTPAPTELPDKKIVTLHLHDPSPGKCRVQNRAIEKAFGDVMVFLDDDLIVARDYLDRVEEFFTDHPEFGAMKGRILPEQDPFKVAGRNWIYLDLPFVDHGDSVIEVGGMLGANMAIRAGALRKVGLFDERLGPGAAGHEEETEMSVRLRRRGYKIGYAPRALVYHTVDPARANRERFIRIGRERGYCRMIHERHSLAEVALKNLVAATRLGLARAMRASPERVAREERRWAVARGMWAGRRARRQWPRQN
jgi:GT2 family glycosyltransferase